MKSFSNSKFDIAIEIPTLRWFTENYNHKFFFYSMNGINKISQAHISWCLLFAYGHTLEISVQENITLPFFETWNMEQNFNHQIMNLKL